MYRAASACEILRRKSQIAHADGIAISAGKNEPDLVQHAARVFDARDEKTRNCCARGDVAFRPSFPDSPTVKYSFRKTGRARERRHYARGCNRARLTEGKSCGRRAMRRTGNSCGACRNTCGFLAKQAPCKHPTPCNNPPPLQRGFNGFAILLQSATMYNDKTLSIQKYSFPKKHLNCGETMPEFSARYEIAFSARARVCSGGVGESVAVSPVRRRGKVFP